MSNEITIDRLERAVTLGAFLVQIDGEIRRPLYDRLARELAELRQQPGAAGAGAVER